MDLVYARADEVERWVPHRVRWDQARVQRSIHREASGQRGSIPGIVDAAGAGGLDRSEAVIVRILDFYR